LLELGVRVRGTDEKTSHGDLKKLKKFEFNLNLAGKCRKIGPIPDVVYFSHYFAPKTFYESIAHLAHFA
jgi:hypothetical protein